MARGSLLRLTPVLALTLATACGGGGSSGPNPPPPPPPAAVVPANVTVDAGDNQQGEPGFALPIRPAVTVRSASGAPVSGVNVTFSVDSGGGSLSATTAVTNSSGFATAGDWTLGPAEGNNVLLVTVSGVTPVKIRAQGKIGPVRTLISNRTIPTSGGTITFSKPGDPLDKLSVDIPNKAYPTATTWIIQADTGTVVPVPAGFTQAGPTLVVSNGAGFADSAMLVTVPLAIPAANAVVPFFFDPATGQLEGIPLVARTDTSISFGTNHFSNDLLASAAVAPASLRNSANSASSASAVSFGQVRIVFLQIPSSQLVGTWSTTFLPGVDDWEFPNNGSFLGTGGICAGMSMSALFYHYFVRAKGQPPLYRRYDKSFVNEWDNVQGIDLAGGIQQSMSNLWSTHSNTVKALSKKAKTAGTLAENLTSTWLALTLRATGKPTMLDLKGSAGAHAVIVYKVTATPTQVIASIANPNNPGAGQTITYDANGVMTPFPLPTRVGATPISFDKSYAWGVSSYVPLNVIQTHWQLFLAGQAGGDWIPPSHFEVWDSVNGAWSPLGDTVKSTNDVLKIRYRCALPGCAENGAGPKDVQLTDIFNGPGDVILANWHNPTLGLVPGTSKHWISGGAWNPFEDAVGFLDGKYITMIYGQFAASPRNLIGKPDTAYTFTASNGGLGTATSQFIWDFGDGTPLKTVVGDSVVTHVYDTAGTYIVKTELREGGGKLLGKQSSGASIKLVQAKIIEPNGPFLVDQFYKYAYSLGGYPVGTKFRWDFHNGRFAYAPSIVTNDSTRTLLPTEMGHWTIKVTATAPDGALLGTDSTFADITSDQPWPMFEVTAFNLNPVSGTVLPFVNSPGEPTYIFRTDTSFFNRIVRNETKMYFVYVPKDTFDISGRVLPGIGVYYFAGNGAPYQGGGGWRDLVKWIRPGVCPIVTSDPTLKPVFTHPGSTLGGAIDGFWPMRSYNAIIGPGCGNVNIIPRVADEIHMSFGGSTATGSFRILYEPGAHQWTLGATFSAVRVR